MRYVIDVTQLVHWSGNLTGIPRVMDELSIRFLKNIPNVIFVSWVKEVGTMCEIDFASTRTHRGDGIDYMNKIGTQSKNMPIKAKVLRPFVPKRFVKKAIKKTAYTIRLDRTSFYKKIASEHFNTIAHNYKIYRPKPGDKLFIPWGEWWDQNWLSLVQTYAKNGVAIYPVCHDILPMTVPQFSGNSDSLIDFVSQIFPIATIVLTPSESTKKDLLAWMLSHNLETPTIATFRLGEDFSVMTSKFNDTQLLKKYDVRADDYLVYVSTIEPRKNHALLYYTYKLAHSRDIQLPKLLIVGRVGHDVSEIIKVINEDSDVNDRIAIYNNVNDADLSWLYENCKFLVMPSFYEGWGMSIIEGIARGKSAVCSNTSSLLEMPNDCVIRFSPASTDECLDAITTMMKPEVLKQYRDNTKHYKLHSWDGAFRQVLDILKRGV